MLGHENVRELRGYIRVCKPDDRQGHLFCLSIIVLIENVRGFLFLNRVHGSLRLWLKSL